MFAATFLGHQGWLLSSSRTHVLVDPLLVEPFGHGGEVGRIYPPRRVDPAAFRNEDHFDIPSLNRIARRVPIRGGDGSCFCAVDAEPAHETAARVRALVGRPGLWCHTNNVADWQCALGGVVVEDELPRDSLALAQEIARRHAEFCFTWAEPAAVLLCGGGYSFDGERAWLDHNVFTADSTRIAAALGALTRCPVLAPVPGQTVRMKQDADGARCRWCCSRPALRTCSSYEPQSCSVRVRCGDPVARYVAGVECWASDLLAAFRGEIGPTAIVFGRGRAWSFAPERVPMRVSIFWDYFHPLVRPEAFVALYRRLLAREPASVPRVPAVKRAASRAPRRAG